MARDEMDVIERKWTIYTPKPDLPDTFELQVAEGDDGMPDAPMFERVVVVPEAQLAGAVEALRASREHIAAWSPHPDHATRTLLARIDAALSTARGQ